MAKPNIFSIIPKPKEQEPNIVNIVFWLGVCVLIGLSVAYLMLRAQAMSLTNKKTAVVEERSALIADNAELTKKMMSLSRNISDYLSILKDHRVSSNFYGFLSSVCHRRAQFTSLTVSDSANHISLGLKTESFKTLGEQLLILKEHPLIKNTKFSGLNIGKDGKIVCTLDFDFDEKIILPFSDL